MSDSFFLQQKHDRVSCGLTPSRLCRFSGDLLATFGREFPLARFVALFAHQARGLAERGICGFGHTNLDVRDASRDANFPNFEIRVCFREAHGVSLHSEENCLEQVSGVNERNRLIGSA